LLLDFTVSATDRFFGGDGSSIRGVTIFKVRLFGGDTEVDKAGTESECKKKTHKKLQMTPHTGSLCFRHHTLEIFINDYFQT